MNIIILFVVCIVVFTVLESFGFNLFKARRILATRSSLWCSSREGGGSEIQKINEILLQFAAGIKVLEDGNIELQKANIKSEKANTDAVVENREEQRKLRRSLNELIGYNQNIDRNVEISMVYSLKKYLEQTLLVPSDCIIEVDEHSIIDPESGDTAVEWDGILVIDYTDLMVNNFSVPQHWPAHGTVFLLEVKQTMDSTAVLKKLPTRIRKTIKALTSTTIPSKGSVRMKVSVQKARYPKDPVFTVALGGGNVDDTVAEQILESGYLAIGPSGDNFQVLQSPSHRVQIFNASSSILEC